MAQVFGEPGRNAAEESYKQTRRFLLVAFVGIGVLSLIEGFMLGGLPSLNHLSWAARISIFIFLLLVVFVIGHWATKKMDAVERERILWRKGARGEWLTAKTLKSLPSGYVVINDVTKKLGNIILF